MKIASLGLYPSDKAMCGSTYVHICPHVAESTLTFRRLELPTPTLSHWGMASGSANPNHNSNAPRGLNIIFHWPRTQCAAPSWVSSQPILTGVKPRWVHDRLLVQFPVLLVQTHIIVGSLGINLLLRMMTQVDPSKGPRGQNKQAHRRKVNDLSSKWLPKSTTLWFDFFLRAKH